MSIYDPKDDFDQPRKPVKRTPSAAELYMIALQNLEKTRTNKTPAEAAVTTPAPPSSANTSPGAPAKDCEVTAQTASATNPNPAPATGIPASAAETDTTAPDPHVERCMQAFRDAEKAARARGQEKYHAKCAGQDAFKSSIPPLNGEENIRGFIACVTQAMILDIFRNDEGTKLLYAAQVAHTASKRAVQPARSPGRPPA